MIRIIIKALLDLYATNILVEEQAPDLSYEEKKKCQHDKELVITIFENLLKKNLE